MQNYIKKPALPKVSKLGIQQLSANYNIVNDTNMKKDIVSNVLNNKDVLNVLRKLSKV